MFVALLLSALAAFAVLPSSALRMTVINTYAGTTCSGSSVYSSLPIDIADKCISASAGLQANFVFNSSSRISCGKYEYWLGSNTCSGTPLTSTALDQCIPAKDFSYKFACADFDNLVKVDFRYGGCNSTAAAATSSVYVPVNQCVPTSGSAWTTVLALDVDFQRSYRITSNADGTYEINYYYTGDCTGDRVLFGSVKNGGCSTQGSGGGSAHTSEQSATITKLGTGSDASSVMSSTGGLLLCLAIAAMMM